MAARATDKTMEPTIKVVGRQLYESRAAEAQRAEVNPPTALIKEVCLLLGHKTAITARMWYRLFPGYKAWQYAIDATRNVCRHPNYKYFLKCLVEAFVGGEGFLRKAAWLSEKLAGLGKKPFQVVAARAETDDLSHRLAREHGADCTCERCFAVHLARQSQQRGLQGGGLAASARLG